MNPDLVNILIVLSPVLALGLLFVWISTLGRKKAMAAFERAGWSVATRARSSEAIAARERVHAILGSMTQAKWGTRGVYWFGWRTLNSEHSCLVVQYQHVNLAGRYSKPVPLAIAAVASPWVTCSADIRQGKAPSILFRDVAALFDTPVPMGDPDFDARWTVMTSDPERVSLEVLGELQVWLSTLPPSFRCVLVPGYVLVVADRWFQPSDPPTLEPLIQSLSSIPNTRRVALP